MKVTRLFREFFESEKAGGLVLIVCTAISLLLANTSAAGHYLHLWHLSLAGQPLEYWINDGLMAIFFLLIGLELEREVYIGELSKLKDAMLPICAAIGGMAVPAAIYLFFNYGTPTQAGSGIPMATDIAFALGVLSLLGNRVPPSLKVFLTALAVIDDLGAIIIIAVFYTGTLAWTNLLIAFGIFAVLLLMNRLKVRNLIPYITGGIAMWYFMLHSGVHATITGVLVAFAIPFGNGNEKSTSYLLQQFLHKPVAFFILPLFALANTAISFDSVTMHTLTEHYSLGVAIGLVAGKPLGIFLLSWLAVKAGICKLPVDLTWRSIFGAACLGGIGFTMSIFITLLAFSEEAIISNIKLVILVSSLVAGLIGYTFLRSILTVRVVEDDGS